MSGLREDSALIAEAAQGGRAAFAELIERHGAAVVRLSRALSDQEATAADLAQEAFLAAWAAAGSFDAARGSVRTWLLSITRHAAHRRLRKRREVPEGDPDRAGLAELGVAAGWGASEPDAQLTRAESIERLARAVASLAPEDREVLVLRDIEGVSGAEAALVLGLELRAMKSRLHRARLRLMAALRAEEGGVVAHERKVGALTCREVLERLGDYVDGDLPAAEVQAVEAHVRGCDVCERFGGHYAAVVHAQKSRLGAPQALDAATLERVTSRLRDE